MDTVYANLGTDVDEYTLALVEELCQRFQLRVGSSRQTLLDVGSGKGHQALAFSKYFDVSGTDLEGASQSVFTRKNVPFEFRKCDLGRESFPFQDNSFNIAFNKSVLEHIVDTDHFVSEVVRVLKPGGIAMFMVPSWETQHAHFYDDYTHVKPFTKHGLKSALKINGLQDVQVSEFFQLPFLWKNPRLTPVVRLLGSLLPDSWKFANNDRARSRKFVRFSKETMLLGVGRKSKA